MFVNIGPLERKVRIIAGLALVGIGFTVPLAEQWHLAAMSFGVIALFTAAFGFCPPKALLFRRSGEPS